MNSIAWPAHVHYKPFACRTELEDELAAQIAATLNEACAKHERPSLVVSGGRTPEPLFAKLSRIAIPWHRIVITLADERWVDPADSASNEKLVRDVLLQHKAAAAQFIGLKTHHDSPEAGWPEVEARLVDIQKPFDIVLLGMGEDGHVASLFPGAPQLGAALRGQNLCYAMHPPNAAQARISLTAKALLNTHEIIVYISGAKKLEVVRAALSDNDVKSMPVRFLFQQQRVPVTYYWSPG